MLVGSLASLDDQTAPAGAYDIVVVDNGSTDGTAGFLARWATEGDRRQVRPVRRVVTEPVAGLSRARNAGIAAAGGDIVLFLDDDALAPRGWIDAHLGVYCNSPATAAAGGPVMLTWPEGRPAWLTPRLEHWFSALDHGDRAGPFPQDHGPYGTNMSLRRDVLAEVGGFAEQLGRRRGSLLSSEEAELWRRLWAAGHEITYDPATLLLHRVAAARISRRWLLRRGWGQGRSNARLRVLTGEVAARGQVGAACRGEAGHATRLAVGATRAAVRGDAAAAIDAVGRATGHTAAALEQLWLWTRGEHRPPATHPAPNPAAVAAGPGAAIGTVGASGSNVGVAGVASGSAGRAGAVAVGTVGVAGVSGPGGRREASERARAV
jgi:GT2 family glycosyltransferase